MFRNKKSNLPYHSNVATGVQLAVKFSVQKLCLKKDSQGVAHAFQSRDQERSRFSPLIEEIKELLTGEDEHRVICSRRWANKATNILVREDCVNKLCETW